MKSLFAISFWVTVSIWTCQVYSQSSALNLFVGASNLKYAGVGISVVDLQQGKTICSHNESQSLCPASTLKLLTTSSGLEILGPDFVYRTSVFTDGMIDSMGILQGNIYVQGSGDPTLGSEYLGDGKELFMKKWTEALKKSGIKVIKGSVIVRDELFGYEGVSVKWSWEDLGNYYAPGVYGISVFDNTYRLYLKSGGAGTTPSVLRTEPFIPNLTFKNGLKTVGNGFDSAYIYGIPFSFDRRIYGSMPANRESFMIKGDIPDPGMLLASCFTDYLKQSGIQISGEPSTSRFVGEDPKQKKVLCVAVSNPLSEIIRVINVKSNNHYAEHVFKTLGKGKNAGAEIKNYWKVRGLETNGLFIYDGSGLATVDAIPASFLTRLLLYMNNKSKYAEVFYNSLPVAGSTGTVASFLKGTALDGKVRAKSGSLSKVLCYAGYVDHKGKRFAFSVLVNNYLGTQAGVKKQIEAFLVRFFDNTKSNI